MEPVSRLPTPEEDARWDPWAPDDPADSRITIASGPPDRWGRAPLSASLDGRVIHVDRLDLVSEFHRRRFAKETLDRAFGVEPLDDAEFRGMDALILAAQEEEVLTWVS
jgi:hypothetical protein